MTFNPISYKLTRNEALSKVNNYLDVRGDKNAKDFELIQRREEVLDLPYNELLIVQSSIEIWEDLLEDPNLPFRRLLCANAHNLSKKDVAEELGVSTTSGSPSNLFNGNVLPKWPRPYKLTVLFNHPWQLANKETPDKFSYSESPEFFEDNVADRINVWNLGDERSNVKHIHGYVITNPVEIFPQEFAVVTGRWVTSFPEFDYFEFHLNNEPLIDKNIRKAILKVFPLANHMITTYRPFKPLCKRSLWVIIPKDKTVGTYQGMLHELKEHREYTEYHCLK